MSENVVDLRVAGHEAVPDVIEALEGWLELARVGEIRSLSMCGICTGNQVRTFSSRSNDRVMDLGVAQLLVARIQQSILDDMMPV